MKFIARASTRLVSPTALVTQMVATWRDARSATTEVYVQAMDGVGAPVATANGVKLSASSGTHNLDSDTCKDGSTGSIVVFNDYRSTSRLDLYAQRINSSCSAQWTAGGVAICTAAGGDKTAPVVVADGLGGAIVAWIDARGAATPAVYVQRINSSGAVQWTADGVAVSSDSARTCSNISMASDGSGGCVLAWRAFGSTRVVRAQKINSSGVAQWTAGGVQILSVGSSSGCDVGGILYDSGGCYLGVTNLADGHVQRLASDGSIAAGSWISGGIQLTTASDLYSFNPPRVISDGSGGVIAIWLDVRAPGGSNIGETYAQRLSSSGAIAWTAGGARVLSGELLSAGAQSELVATSDANGGAFFSLSYLFGSDTHIQSGRVDSSGNAVWGVAGVTVISAAGNQSFSQIASDGASGVWIAWTDNSADIYAQRVDADGNLRLGASGVAVSAATGNQTNQHIHGA